eukprot:TRINITY_DN13958_c0_g1_i1.p2 TRINITY_DN13958_c0_g1~~TRINITY_DN13958_c0_g1_i1.p2  ORF type:complete len:139 (-),score=36.76 TRINITY_DN13958_c0_g1_i1:488-904(-)
MCIRDRSTGARARTMSARHFEHINPPNSDFCSCCGGLLTIPDFGKHIECANCNTQTAVTDFEQKSLFSSNKPRAFAPDACMGGQATNRKDQLATVKETCPKCGYEEMAFYCLQLRSVDEGQTVFYSCLNCGHTYATNT